MQIEIARTSLARMKGLLGRSGLPEGHGLLLRPCNAVHTLFMRFPLDLRFLDRTGKQVRMIQNVPPGKWWIWGGFKAYAVLETQAGDNTFDELDLQQQLQKVFSDV